MHDTVPQELASCSWHRVTMLPLPHLPLDQLRKYCNARHLCDLLITPLSARTHLFSDTGRIPVAQLMATCLPALAINGNHSEQPPLAPGPPLSSGGPLSDHGVLRCEGASPPPRQAQTSFSGGASPAPSRHRPHSVVTYKTSPTTYLWG